MSNDAFSLASDAACGSVGARPVSMMFAMIITRKRDG
jgi:hypothetical protein